MKMDDVLGLVRQGRLDEATQAIQARLGGEAPSAPTERPMKDVTPKAAALAGPGMRAEPKARPKFKMKPRAWARAAPDAGDIVPDGGRWERRTGALPHRLYVPAAPDAAAPLIVMLHGCTQNPEDFARGTRMNRAADGIGAHVLWPEQTRAANPNGCWNWFEPAHQGTGGEPGAIAALIEGIRGEIGDRPACAAGLSAGGAMAAVLGARFPGLVSAVGIHSGLPVGSARDVPSAFSAMGQGGAQAAALACPAILFHGDADRTVSPRNADAFGAPRGGRAVSEGGRRARVAATEGARAMEVWRVEGLGHAWSGGDASGSHADPAGPDATAHMLRFFREHAKR